MRIITMVLAATAVSTATISAQQQVDETFPSDATGTVQISNVSGRVTVHGWDRNEIRVTGALGRGTERLELDRGRQRSEIRVVIPRNARNVRGSDLHIRVPVGKQVTVSTVSADIEIGGVRGAVNARSTSGEVEIDGRPAAVRATSTSGDVTVNVSTDGRVVASTTSGDVTIAGSVGDGVSAESVSGDVVVTARTQEVRAKSVSGDVGLEGVRGRASGSTVSGDVRVVGGQLQYASLESVSGDLLYEGDLSSGAAFDLESHSGDITLVLPRGVGADFDVRTFSGSIQSQFGGEVRRTSQYGPGRELRISNGGSGGILRIQTFSGTVKLQRR